MNVIWNRWGNYTGLDKHWFALRNDSAMFKLLSGAVFCGLAIFTTCVEAQSVSGSSSSKGVFLDHGQLTGGHSGSFAFGFGLDGSSLSATSGGTRLQYFESKSNDWGATVLYDGKPLIRNSRFMLVYTADLSAESDCSIEYDVTTKSTTNLPAELYVKQTLNNDEGKPLVTITFDTKVSAETLKLTDSNGKQREFDLSKATILIINEDGDVKQENLPDDSKEKHVGEMIRAIVEKQK